MTDYKSQFLYLLNCFLNGKTPKNNNYDWQGIYTVSIWNFCITLEISIDIR